jgi:type I restriction enzyme M protein
MKVRVDRNAGVDPWLLFAGLNSPIAKRQIRAKRFTQDIIDSLGNRLREICVPIQKDATERKQISKGIRDAIQRRAELRERLGG